MALEMTRINGLIEKRVQRDSRRLDSGCLVVANTLSRKNYQLIFKRCLSFITSMASRGVSGALLTSLLNYAGG
jgi:hypothetical protein